MKLKLPLTLLAALVSSVAYAATPNTSGTDTIGSGTYTYTTEADGTVKAIFTGNGATGTNDGGYTKGKGHLGGVSSDYVNNNGNKRVATNTDLTIGGVDADGNVIATTAKRVTASGVKGYVVTGNKKVTVKEGASVELLLGGYDLDTKYGINSLGVAEEPTQHSTGTVFAPKSPSTATISINVEGGNVAQIYGSYVSKNIIDNEINAAKKNLKGDALAEYLANPAWAQNEQIDITLSGGKTGLVVGGGFNGACNNTVSVKVTGEDTSVDFIYAGAHSTGDGGFQGHVKNTNVTIEGGTITGSVYGGGYNANSYVQENTSVIITGGTIKNNVYGAGDGDTVKGSTYVEINGGNVDGDVYGGGKNGSTVETNTTVALLDGNVKGTIKAGGKDEASEVKGNKTLIVGTEEKAYTGTVGNIEGFDTIIVAEGSSLHVEKGNAFVSNDMTVTLSTKNLSMAAINCATAELDGALTLSIGFEGAPKSGKYMIIASDSAVQGWDQNNITLKGVAGFDDLQWSGNTLYFVYRGVDIDAMTTANWGVFKSSQAFTGTLWAPRPAESCLDLTGENKYTAWGTVYSHNSRIGSNGADYSIYGGAIGVEKTLSAKRFIGAALGYDWGKVKPFSTSSVDQDSFHLAAYGRAWHWCPNSTDAVSIDWSAAYGSTTSDHSSIAGDWTQDSLQLDARATYHRELSERTTVNAFVGAQYYAQGSDTVGDNKAKAMQNLRFMLGGGISYQLNKRTALYGEASLYQDVDRHNPSVTSNGAQFYCTNPGRFGGNVSAGVEYKLNNNWSMRANYGFSTADDQNEHYINVGAVYKF